MGGKWFQTQTVGKNKTTPQDRPDKHRGEKNQKRAQGGLSSVSRKEDSAMTGRTGKNNGQISEIGRKRKQNQERNHQKRSKKQRHGESKCDGKKKEISGGKDEAECISFSGGDIRNGTKVPSTVKGQNLSRTV